MPRVSAPPSSRRRPPALTARLARAVAPLLVVILLAGCASTLRAPELGRLYDRAALHHGPERNPVILIPGLTGSRLMDGDSGRAVWGAFAGGFADPSTPAGARLVALPMAEGRPLAELRDTVYPEGVLDRVRLRVLGVPVDVRAYVPILAILGLAGYQDESLGKAGAVDYGDDHYTCFQFDYDWRRDNVENARRLGEFIAEKRRLVAEQRRQRYGDAGEPVRFDVVAHSMGGVLLRYYLRYGGADLPPGDESAEVTWAGADDVGLAVLVGSPNAGTLDALEQLVRGRDYGPFVPTYPAAVLGTFPSGYQLLPRSRHGTVVQVGEEAEPLDLFDPQVWEAMGWGLADPKQGTILAWLLPDLPPEERRRVARDHLAKVLHRAERFTAALDQPAPPPPDHLRLMLVAGDSVATRQAMIVDPDTGRLTTSSRAAGDGTVLRSSALGDERLDGSWGPMLRSPIPWDQVLFVFNDHLGLTQSPLFADNLLYHLLEAPREEAR